MKRLSTSVSPVGPVRRIVSHGALALVAALLLTAGACGNSAPTAPTPPPDPSPSPVPGPAPAPNPVPQAPTLSGVVTARDTGARITGARVTILDGSNAGRTATTTAGGEYRFEDLQPGNANVSAAAAGFDEARAGVLIDGAVRLDFALVESAPLLSIGPGQHRVGSGISAGRYFTDPQPGCYWERQSGTGGSAGETIAFDFIGFDAAQWIVDVLPSDAAFQTNGPCGTWSNRPAGGVQTSVRPGMWLVGAQVLPGTYRTSAAAGCFWERLRDFSGTTQSVIASQIAPAAGTLFVTIAAEDAGFATDAGCGTWVRTGAAAAAASAQQQPGAAAR